MQLIIIIVKNNYRCVHVIAIEICVQIDCEDNSTNVIRYGKVELIVLEGF